VPAGHWPLSSVCRLRSLITQIVHPTSQTCCESAIVLANSNIGCWCGCHWDMKGYERPAYKRNHRFGSRADRNKSKHNWLAWFHLENIVKRALKWVCVYVCLQGVKTAKRRTPESAINIFFSLSLTKWFCLERGQVFHSFFRSSASRRLRTPRTQVG